MRSVLAWLAVSLFFVAINALGAALIYALFALGQRLVPSLMDEPLFVMPLGMAGVTGAVWVAIIAVRELNARQRRAPARGRA